LLRCRTGRKARAALTATTAATLARTETTRRRRAHAVGDAGLLEVVRAHLHLHHVACGDLDEVLAQLAGNVSEHLVPVRQFNPEHGAWENGNDLALHFNRISVGHIIGP